MAQVLGPSPTWGQDGVPVSGFNLVTVTVTWEVDQQMEYLSVTITLPIKYILLKKKRRVNVFFLVLRSSLGGKRMLLIV